MLDGISPIENKSQVVEHSPEAEQGHIRSMWRLNEVTTPIETFRSSARHPHANLAEANPLLATSAGCSNVNYPDIVLARDGNALRLGHDPRHRRDTAPRIDDEIDRCKTGPAGLD